MSPRRDVLAQGIHFKDLEREIRESATNATMWTRSFFVSTAGNVSSYNIQKYIAQQKTRQGPIHPTAKAGGLSRRIRKECTHPKPYRKSCLSETLNALDPDHRLSMVLVRPGAEQLAADFFEPGSRRSRKHSYSGTMVGPPVRGPRKGTDGDVRVARGSAASFDFDGLRRKGKRAIGEFLPEQLGCLVFVPVRITEGPGWGRRRGEGLMAAKPGELRWALSRNGARPGLRVNQGFRELSFNLWTQELLPIEERRAFGRPGTVV